MPLTSKDARRVVEYEIDTYRKGIICICKGNDIITYEYLQFKEIYSVNHHINIGVEIVFYNKDRRVFYNDDENGSQNLFNTINSKMIKWMKSNLN